jgi:DNA polymerase III delta subunit
VSQSPAEKIISQILASSNPPRCLILVSADRLRRDRVVSALKSKFELSPKRYVGKSLDKNGIARISEDLQTLSLFEDSSAVLIDGAEEIQAKLAPQLAALISRLSEGCSLILSMERRPKSTTIWNAFSNSNCTCIEFPVFKDGGSGRDANYNAWFQQELGKSSSGKQPQGLATFCWEVAEGDVDQISLMMQQLALFCDGGHISLESARELFPHTTSPRIFDLTDALLEGDRTKAMRIITELAPAKEGCFGLLGLISKSLSRVISLVDLESKRVPVAEVRKRLKLEHERAYLLHKRAAAKYSRAALVQQLELVVKTDARLKNASLSEQALMAQLIAGLC